MKKVFNWLKNHQKQLLGGLGLFSFYLIFLLNSLHTQFPDEYDNIFGGFLINQGVLPQVGFFAHHNPGAYFLASLITLFTQRSFVAFRLVSSLVFFVWFWAGYLLLKKRVKNFPSKFYIGFGLIWHISATYYWGQMFLSETLVSYFLIPVYALVVLKWWHKQAFEFKDLVWVSILTFLSLFVSLTYVFAVFGLVIWAWWFYLKSNKDLNWKNILKSAGVLIAPYLAFLIYLLLTSGLGEFYFQCIRYNVDYYIYNFPQVAGQVSKNPVRYAVSIFWHTLDQVFLVLVQLKDFNFTYPFNVTITLSTVVLILVLALVGNWLWLLVFWLTVFLNARSEPLNIKEIDFHATVYIVFSILNAALSFYLINQQLAKAKLAQAKKVLLSFLLVLLAIYSFMASLFLANKFVEKYYAKFMGEAPLIYNRPEIAPLLNRLVAEDEYYWIGPFELHELLFIKGKLPGKFFWFLPANIRSEKIRTEFMAAWDEHPPKVIVFKAYFSQFGVSPEEFNYLILDYLAEHYFQIQDLETETERYLSLVPGTDQFTLERDFYFNNDQKAEIVQQLLDQGLIKHEDKAN